ncbi:unnamed protein product [Ectocarpus sp. CCAP 1310/34]|nr:unnamed protein product [Ectocarpus sp. CCAP 1310/34]
MQARLPIGGLGILGYVVRTSDLGITFRRGSLAGLSMEEVFADADYASKAADRRSVSGGLVMCGEGCISWFSRTQKCVTLSTTERGGVWRFMLPEAGMPCIPVFEDNQGAIQLAQNPISYSNSKHIDVRQHLIRELVGRKEISIFHVESAYQHADFLTKALHVGDFEFHCNFVMSVGQERTVDLDLFVLDQRTRVVAFFYIFAYGLLNEWCSRMGGNWIAMTIEELQLD